MNIKGSITALSAVSIAALAGCAEHVTRTEFDTTVAELRENNQHLRSDLDATRIGLDSTHSGLVGLQSELASKFQAYDTTVSELQGRVRVDMSAHFDVDKSELHDQDKLALNDFASVIHKHYPSAVVTVEGFTDAAGSTSYNKRLGLRRARTVRDYLVQEGGLNPQQLRVISYGKARNRQIVPGAKGDQGQADRRVALVVEDSGLSATKVGAATARPSAFSGRLSDGVQVAPAFSKDSLTDLETQGKLGVGTHKPF